MITLPLLTRDPIDAGSLEERVRTTEHGAVVTFQGVVRKDRTEGGEIALLRYEAYEAMALREMTELMQELARRWPGTAAVMQHRLGDVAVGETSVFIAVSSPHRAQAFQACHFAIEGVKTRVPIWKKDVYLDGKSAWTACRHDAMLISDDIITIPES